MKWVRGHMVWVIAIAILVAVLVLGLIVAPTDLLSYVVYHSTVLLGIWALIVIIFRPFRRRKVIPDPMEGKEIPPWNQKERQ